MKNKNKVEMETGGRTVALGIRTPELVKRLIDEEAKAEERTRNKMAVKLWVEALRARGRKV